MPTEDEILEQVRHRASAIRRRQRVLRGGATAVVAMLVVGGAVAASGDGGGDTLSTADAPPTAAVEPAETDESSVPPATEPPPVSLPEGSVPPRSEGSTVPVPDPPLPEQDSPDSMPEGDAPPEEVPPVSMPEAPPPPDHDLPPVSMPEAISETYSGSATKSGLTVDVAVTVPSSPGERGVTVRVRVRTARGGAVGGYIVWSGSPLDPGSPDVGPFGDVHTQNPDGCDPAPTPDPNAGPVDLSFDLTHTYGARPASYTVKVLAYSSACYAERAVTEVAVPITLR